jgi:predicted transcriptional regulator
LISVSLDPLIFGNIKKSAMIDRKLLDRSTTEIVASYVEHNMVSAADLLSVIEQVRQTLDGLNAPVTTAAKLAVSTRPGRPAVPIARSATPERIICLEDGEEFQSLTKHLRSKHNMSPQEYRTRWRLDVDYPMVTQKHSERRSMIAKEIGLGKLGRDLKHRGGR